MIGQAAIAAGVLLAVGLYLLLSRQLLRIAIGFLLLSNGINLFVITAAGAPARAHPPVLRPEGPQPVPMVDPLPHALLLTAIVIGLAAAAFLLALAVRTRTETGSGELPPGGGG